MSDEDIKQRIAYLVQYGGLWEDPLEDMRKGLRWAVGIGAAGVVLGGAAVGMLASVMAP